MQIVKDQKMKWLYFFRVNIFFLSRSVEPSFKENFFKKMTNVKKKKKTNQPFFAKEVPQVSNSQIRENL